MKLSMCSTWGKDKKLEEAVEVAEALGLDGIELWDGHIDGFLARNACSIRDLNRYLQQKKLECAGIAPYFNLLDDGEIALSLKNARKCIQYAHALGCSVIRTFIGRKPSKEVSEAEWRKCIPAMKRMSSMAEEAKLYFAMETHNNMPTDRVDVIAGLLMQTGEDGFKVLFDGYNFTLDHIDMEEAHEKLKKHIVHYHIKNYITRENSKTPAPIQSGDADFTGIIRQLKGEGYSGFLSFEYFCPELQPLIQQSIEWIRTI